MRSTRRGLFRRGRHDGGASAVEYALILAGLALVAVGTIYLLNRSVKGAFVAAEGSVSSTVQPSSVPSSALPTTTSAAPTTTSAAPTTTSPAPTTTSPAPTTSPPAGATTARRGRNTTIDPNLPNNSDPRGTPTVTPDVGSVDWGNGNNSDQIVFRPDSNAPLGPVTITYQYRVNGQTFTRTITVWVTA